MTFASQLNAFAEKAKHRERAIFTGSVEAVAQSVVFGSEITGSPGQPEDLRRGEWVTQYEGESTAVISTDDPSAPSVEDGISRFDGSPIKLKSPIGGLHSVLQTRLNFDKLVDDVAQRTLGDRLG
jgi:hypothetical protein